MAVKDVEEIRVGQVAVRFLVEGKASGGSVAVFEFDVPAGGKVPIAHSNDAYEERRREAVHPIRRRLPT